jgi:hypothetical protein
MVAENQESVVYCEDFSDPQTFTAFEGRVNGNIIKGVSLIQKGPALGHKHQGYQIVVDDKALREFARIAKEMSRVKVKFNHFTGIQDTVGFAQNFRVSSGKVLADITLLKTHPSKEMLLEMVDEISGTFGVSLNFGISEHEWDDANEVYYVRPKSIFSADFVDTPAANKDGVFEAGIDSAENDMANLTVEAFDAYKSEAAKAQSDAIAALSAEIAALKAALEKPADPPAPAAAPETVKPDAALSAEIAELKTLIKAFAAAPPTNQPVVPPNEPDSGDPLSKSRNDFEALSHTDRNAFMAKGGKIKL